MQLLGSSGNLFAIKGMLENPLVPYNHDTKFQKFSIFFNSFDHIQVLPLCLLDPEVTSWLRQPGTEPRLMVAANSDGHMT